MATDLWLSNPCLHKSGGGGAVGGIPIRLKKSQILDFRGVSTPIKRHVGLEFVMFAGAIGIIITRVSANAMTAIVIKDVLENVISLLFPADDLQSVADIAFSRVRTDIVQAGLVDQDASAAVV